MVSHYNGILHLTLSLVYAILVSRLVSILDGYQIDEMQFQINCVRENTEIIHRSDYGLKLSFLESLAIKEHKPELNRGLKSCKDLSLF